MPIYQHPNSLPFAHGDRVLHRRHPGEALTVTGCEPHPYGGWTVRCTASASDGLGQISESAPDDRYIKAPDGWCNPPVMPSGSIRYGLSEADRQAAQDSDDSSIEFQRAMSAWHRAMASWCKDWLALVDPKEAIDQRYRHLMAAEYHEQMIEAMSLLNAVE